MATELKDQRALDATGKPLPLDTRAELREPLVVPSPDDQPSADPSNQLPSEMIDNLLKFEIPMEHLDRSVLVSSFKTVLKECLGIFPSIIGPPLVVAFGIVSINLTNRPEVQATFGLFNSYTLMFTIAVELSLMDKLGIDLSTSFGAKDYAGCRKDLTKGSIINLLFFLTACLPMMYFSQTILLTIGIAYENAAGVQTLTRMYIFVIPLILIAEQLKTFCMAQGLEHYFGKIGMINNTLNIIFNYVMIVHLGFGAEAILIGRGIFSSTEIFCGYYFVLSKTVPETRGFVPIQEALAGFSAYFFECLSFVFGTYSEFIGFEIATYFVALLHNNNMIAAYSAVVSITGIIYCTGMAFAIICRTRINILIGMQKFQVAVNYFDFFIKSAAGTGVLLGVVSAVLTPWIAASFASSNDEMYWHFVTVYLIYCVYMGSETSVYCSFVGMKTVGHVRTLVKLNCIWMITANFVGCLLAFLLTDGPGWILLSVMNCLIVLNYTCYKTTIDSDWSVAKTEESGHQGQEKEMKSLEHH